MANSRVALVRGNDRRANIRQALELIADDIDLAGKERIIIKPNFVSAYRSLAATHPDAVRAVLGFLAERGVTDVTLAEGPATSSLDRALASHNYGPLLEDYGLPTVDLNRDRSVDVRGVDQRLNEISLQLARTAVESDLRISVGPPKTHDTVNVTLSLKNLAMGSLQHKRRAHQGYQGINLNLYYMAYHVAPHLSIIDGFRAMEGNGPTGGSLVNWRIAVASTNFLSADALTTRLMGFDLEEIGYLYYCQRKGLGRGDPSHMEVLGNVQPDEVRRRFKRHRRWRRQLAWRIDDVERYL